MTDYPGEQFPPAVDPDVEPGFEPEPDEETRPDYDAEPGPESRTPWVNPTLQGRPHTDPLLAGFTVYGDPTPTPDAEPEPEPDPVEDTEQAFEASLEEPTRHSFVDDGLDESYDDQPAESEAEPEPAPAPVVPSPAATFPRPPVQPAAQALPGPGSSTPAETSPRPAAPQQAFPRPAAPAPGRAFPRPAAPAPGPAFPRPAAPAAGPAFPRPSAPAPVVQAPAASAGVVPVGERGEDEVHPLVEDVMERLDGLRERAVGEHAEVYAELHERLQSALVEADADHGDRG